MNPRYPIYIVSKGRSDTRLTARSLEMMRVPYYIVIEPHDYDNYAAVIDETKILILPVENHGNGPGLARNWCWEHAIQIGAERHWVMDDNINYFFRLNNNLRFVVSDGTIFRCMEDFVDRYENIYIAGPQYYMFCRDWSKWPAYVANTRIYSCLLIQNNIPYRWRGRYNEDTDLSLRVLKDGFCTVQFNAFLQRKIATQLIGGGNTAEFYAKEGTTNKSKMLERMHPDVARVITRWGRVHHYVDYSPFKKNKLIRKPGWNYNGINNYGMNLVQVAEEKKTTKPNTQPAFILEQPKKEFDIDNYWKDRGFTGTTGNWDTTNL